MKIWRKYRRRKWRENAKAVMMKEDKFEEEEAYEFKKQEVDGCEKVNGKELIGKEKM